MNDEHQVVALASAGLASASRRKLFKASVALGALGMMAYLPVKSVLAAKDAAALPATVGAFQKLAQFLTSRPVDPVLAQRYYDALKKRDAGLDKSVDGLKALVDQKKLGHMDDYLALQDVDKTLDTCAKTIVRALYLGVVGDDEKSELIAYKEAFMYKPTEDVLVVPTYGRGPATWGYKPVEKKV